MKSSNNKQPQKTQKPFMLRTNVKAGTRHSHQNEGIVVELIQGISFDNE